MSYRDWRDRGAGGLPHNVLGFTVATALRAFGRDTLAPDPSGVASAPPVDPLHLPTRTGARPRLSPEPVPHRQTTQHPAEDPTPADVLAVLAERAGPVVDVGRSHFERHGDALVAGNPDPRATWLVRSRGEVAHRHASDGSWHVVLHPADAQAVVAAGWGERHPLAGVPLLGLPRSYLIVYAPRDDAEVDVVLRIVGRALSWAAAPGHGVAEGG